jgi:hypothetical protein
MSNSPEISTRRRPAPLSVRFNAFELETLRRRAGSRPISTYVKQAALGDETALARRSAPAPSVDRAMLAQALARLGRSRLANNLNQLAKAVHIGILPVNEFTEADIRSACADVRTMRRMLLLALGLKAESLPDAASGLSAEFSRTVTDAPSSTTHAREAAPSSFAEASEGLT